MRMSIDKAIEEVQQQKLDYQEFWEEYKNEHIEALDMAIDTMRKYQRIKQIIADWRSDGGVFEMTELYWLRLISEVIEDENVD